jgi:uncharacterized OB-fold protein
VAEIYAPFTSTEIAAVEALGFCEKGRGGFLSEDGAGDVQSAGVTASEFLRRLRDERRISGVHCPGCRRIILPPRGFCNRCFLPAGEWVDVVQTGILEAITITSEPFDGLPDPPYAIAYGTLDGASTAMLDFVGGVDLSELEAAAPGHRHARGSPVETGASGPDHGFLLLDLT